MSNSMMHVYLGVLMIGCIAIGMAIAHYAAVVPLINKVHQLQAAIKVYQEYQKGF
jgi:hypothetical protein